MTIQQNYPAIVPSLSLDFANVKALDPRITFTRASTATYYGTETAKAEENLLIRSQEIDNAAFFTRRATITANATTAPDGTTTAEQLTDDATSGTHVVAQSLTLIPANETFTYSVFLKKGTNDFAYILAADAVNGRCIAAVANLDTGAITQTFSSFATLTSSSITSVGNDWYRLTITGSVTIAPVRFFVGIAPAASGNTFSGNNENVGISYVGTGTTVFVWGAQLEQRSQVTAYTPTTTQPITNFIPVLESEASGVARFDHNPVTKESLGLLIEEQRTNSVLRSEEFDNAYWTKDNGVATKNVIVAPSGGITGNLFVPSTGTVNSRIRRIISSPTTLSFSIFLKAAGIQFVQLGWSSNSEFNAVFDLQTGTITQNTTGAASASTMTSVGNGWWRCTISSTGVAEINIKPLFTSSRVDINANFTYDGFSGFYLWGGQSESAAFATSYIPTVASQVTRAADAASMTGANFSSWYNQAAGTLYAETVDGSVTGIAQGVASLDSGSADNRIDIRRQNSTSILNFISTNIVDQAVLQFSNTAAIGVSFKNAVAYAFNDVAASLNGATVLTDTLAVLPVVNTLNIGSLAANVLKRNGTISKISYYPVRVTNAQLQGLTS